MAFILIIPSNYLWISLLTPRSVSIDGDCRILLIIAGFESGLEAAVDHLDLLELLLLFIFIFIQDTLCIRNSRSPVELREHHSLMLLFSNKVEVWLIDSIFHTLWVFYRLIEICCPIQIHNIKLGPTLVLWCFIIQIKHRGWWPTTRHLLLFI